MNQFCYNVSFYTACETSVLLRTNTASANGPREISIDLPGDVNVLENGQYRLCRVMKIDNEDSIMKIQ